MLALWAELGAPAVPPAPSGGKCWRSAPAGRSDSTREEVLEPAVRQEELPAVEPAVLLSRRVLLRPLLVLLGRLEARTSVAAGSNGDNLPLLVLHLQMLALSVERAVN